jgi:large subunit ribosomal protein L29
MKVEKIRELAEDELKHSEVEFAEQLFHLRIQMASGQTEGLKKIRTLKKDLARIKTIRREREIKAGSTK